jgi:aspartyl-tRNA(Asn)/glutamyl-tRNA(Gln) amidotransferase subunit C
MSQGKEKISKRQIAKLAQLARIKLSPKEEEQLANDLAAILDYFKDINALPTERVTAIDYYQLEENQTREDESKSTTEKEEERERIKKNFPQRKSGFLRVKAVLRQAN